MSDKPWRNRELIALAALARTGDATARQQLFEAVLPAIRKWEGNLKAIGDVELHVDSDTLSRWFRNFPELRRELDLERALARKSPPRVT